MSTTVIVVVILAILAIAPPLWLIALQGTGFKLTVPSSLEDHDYVALSKQRQPGSLAEAGLATGGRTSYETKNPVTGKQRTFVGSLLFNSARSNHVSSQGFECAVQLTSHFELADGNLRW